MSIHSSAPPQAQHAVVDLTDRYEYAEIHFANETLPEDLLKDHCAKTIASAETETPISNDLKTRIWEKLYVPQIKSIRDAFYELLCDKVVLKNRPNRRKVELLFNKERESISQELLHQVEKIGFAKQVEELVDLSARGESTPRGKLAQELYEINRNDWEFTARRSIMGHIATILPDERYDSREEIATAPLEDFKKRWKEDAVSSYIQFLSKFDDKAIQNGDYAKYLKTGIGELETLNVKLSLDQKIELFIQKEIQPLIEKACEPYLPKQAIAPSAAAPADASVEASQQEIAPAVVASNDAAPSSVAPAAEPLHQQEEAPTSAASENPPQGAVITAAVLPEAEAPEAPLHQPEEAPTSVASANPPQSAVVAAAVLPEAEARKTPCEKFCIVL